MSDSFTRLRLIEYRTGNAAYNMALDEAIAVSCRVSGSMPTLRLYGWDVPSVSLGRFQKIIDVDADLCKASGIPIVRRPTGGRAILHGNELTYSFSASSTVADLGAGVLNAYGVLSEAFMHAFDYLGIDALCGSRNKHHDGPNGINPLCFRSSSYGEISVRGRKIIGSAQRRWPDGFLQQGSIPLVLDREGMERVFKLNRGDDLQMAGINEFDGSITLEGLSDAVVQGFRETFKIDVVRCPPDKIEVEFARRLQKEKYGSERWTLSR